MYERVAGMNVPDSVVAAVAGRALPAERRPPPSAMSLTVSHVAT
jgi:hypothetical protein